VNLRLLALVVAGGLAAALAFRADVRAEPSVLVWHAEPLEGAAPVPEATVKAAADILAKRCKHAGLDVVGVETRDGGRVAVQGGPGFADCEAAVRRLAERRGLVEFRVRAEGPVEDMWRDKRLNEGGAPPPAFEWRLPETGDLQVLVETPEKAAAAHLDALRRKRLEEGALQAAEAELAKVVAESVFTNEQIGAASVQRTMKSWGAQRFLRIAVRFEFRDDRKAAFEKFTGDHVGRPLCVVVDGKVHVAPKIGAALPGTGELTGSGAGYTDEQAQEMAAVFESGPLPCRLIAEK
jgi:preprotein translocase subunit SecD